MFNNIKTNPDIELLRCRMDDFNKYIDLIEKTLRKQQQEINNLNYSYKKSKNNFCCGCLCCNKHIICRK